MGSRLLVMGVSAYPFYRIYKTDTWTLTDDYLTFHTSFVPAQWQRPEISPNGQLMAYGMSATPFLNVVNLQTGADVQVISGKPAGNTNAVAFRPDGTQLAVGFSGSPYLYIYNTADWTRFTPSGLPTNSTLGIAFSPDGTKMAVGSVGSPYLVVYNTADWTKVTITGGAPNGPSYQPHFSPDGTKLAIASSVAPYLTVYNTSDWSKITITGGDLAGPADYACRFSPDGTKLAVGHASSPYLTVYNTSDWSKITLTGGNPPTTCVSLSWSHDGGLLAATYSSSPYINVYNTADWSKLSAFSVSPGSAGKGVLFTDGWQSKTISAVAAPNVILDDTGLAASRAVRAYDRTTGKFLAEQQASASGTFEFSLLTAGEKQVVYLDDAAGDLHNDLIHRVLPG